jgi:hypothetical protein
MSSKRGHRANSSDRLRRLLLLGNRKLHHRWIVISGPICSAIELAAGDRGRSSGEASAIPAPCKPATRQAFAVGHEDQYANPGNSPDRQRRHGRTVQGARRAECQPSLAIYPRRFSGNLRLARLSTFTLRCVDSASLGREAVLDAQNPTVCCLREPADKLSVIANRSNAITSAMKIQERPARADVRWNTPFSRHTIDIYRLKLQIS